jgi:hypothetical protein
MACAEKSTFTRTAFVCGVPDLSSPQTHSWRVSPLWSGLSIDPSNSTCSEQLLHTFSRFESFPPGSLILPRSLQIEFLRQLFSQIWPLGALTKRSFVEFSPLISLKNRHFWGFLSRTSSLTPFCLHHTLAATRSFFRSDAVHEYALAHEQMGRRPRTE